jgi:hypothetical protein
MKNVQASLASDIEGLSHQVDPLSRRDFFLATSAAAAADYTLAAGPVRADAIHTDAGGLAAGDAKVKVGRCRERERSSRSRSIPGRRTASTPITAPATARTRPRTPGTK